MGTAFNVCGTIIVACSHHSIGALKPEEGVCGLGLVRAAVLCDVHRPPTRMTPFFSIMTMK